MTRRAAIPTVPSTGNPNLDKALAAVKENVDAMTGQTKNSEKLAPLNVDSVTTAEIAAQLNAMLARMQGT